MAAKRKEKLPAIVKRLWNEFDPIGVVRDRDRDDEYSGYVRHSVQLILEGADEFRISKFVEHCVHVDMGCSDFPHAETRGFAAKLRMLAQESQ